MSVPKTSAVYVKEIRLYDRVEDERERDDRDDVLLTGDGADRLLEELTHQDLVKDVPKIENDDERHRAADEKIFLHDILPV